MVVECQSGYSCLQQDKQVQVGFFVDKKVWQQFSEHKIIKIYSSVVWKSAEEKKYVVLSSN